MMMKLGSSVHICVDSGVEEVGTQVLLELRRERIGESIGRSLWLFIWRTNDL